MSKQTEKTFTNLSWADLESWAGAKIVSRGQSYQRSKAVKDLAITQEGELLAWVRGSVKYATKASLKKGRLESICTCPYFTTCKHAVAVVLAYLDCLQNNTDVRLAEDGDERLVLLEDIALALNDDEDELQDEEDDEFINEAELETADIDSMLKKKSKQELQDMLAGLIEDHPEMKKDLGFISPSPKKMPKKSCATLVKAVTRDILIASSEPGWRNNWKHTGFTPDYSGVRSGLQRLLDEGYPDEVIKLGEKLFVKGLTQIEQSHDEGETGDEIAESMPLVFQALAKCSLSDADKLERAVDFGLRDEYGLCKGLEEFRQIRFGKKAWSELADQLLVRLGTMKTEKQEDSFTRHYTRNRLADEVILALENAGRAEEAISICFSEAEETYSYVRLVKKLRQEDRGAEAEEWIRKGVAATIDRLPGIAAQLRAELLEMKQRKGDWMFVSALLSDNFFRDPSLKTYEELQKASEKAKVWPQVREACLRFLESGSTPNDVANSWPLPDTGFGKSKMYRRGKPPLIDILIDIAIAEQRIDDVVKWYDAFARSKDRWMGRHLDDRVASSIVSAYPQRAIEIWKSMAEGLIAQTNVSAYGEAAVHLEKVRQAMLGKNRVNEWKEYLNGLLEANRRKPRCVQILKSLDNRPILSR